MGKIQVSERIITNTYETLDEKINKKLSHRESELYIKDETVYKILNKMYRRSREKFLYVLDENEFENCINIKDLLYQGDKLIGCSTPFIKDFESLSEYLKNNNIDLKTKLEFMKRIRYVIESLLQDRLAYFDLHLDNIGISKGEIIFSDLDGVEDNPTRRFIDGTYYNMYLCYLSILLDEFIYTKYDPDKWWGRDYYLNQIIPVDEVNLSNIKDFCNDITQEKVDVLKENYLKLEKR